MAMQYGPDAYIQHRQARIEERRKEGKDIPLVAGALLAALVGYLILIFAGHTYHQPKAAKTQSAHYADK